MKKLFLILPIMAFSLPGFAGTKIGELYYNLNDSLMTAEVTYYSYFNNNQDYVSGDLVIPESITYETKTYTVTEIGSSAFKDCINLTSIEIPNSVTKIDFFAFEGCQSLENIKIPNSVTEIGDNIFRNTWNLTSVELENGNPNYSIKNNVLYSKNFEKLISCPGGLAGNFEIPNSVIEVGDYAFYGCKHLTNIEIPHSVTKFGEFAFSHCPGLTSIEIPNSVTMMGTCAFCNSGLVSVSLPNSLTSINLEVFSYCRNLTSIKIPNTVTWIGHGAFCNCTKLKSVEIPNSVIYIEDYAFEGCMNLNDLTIPGSVIGIGYIAFAGCDKLTNMTIADSMEELSFWRDNFKVTNLYQGRELRGGFYFPSLRTLTVGSFVTRIPASTSRMFYLTSLKINPGAGVVIEDEVLLSCRHFAELTLPEDVAEIGASAFEETSLKNLTLPGGVIGDNAFANCKLENITIGAKVKSIGESAFVGSKNIKNIYVTQTTPPAVPNNIFSTYDAQLWVPGEAIDKYNKSAFWSRFNCKPLVCPEKLTVDGPTSFRGESGDTIRLRASISPANVTLDRVLWRSTNPAVATVDNDGLVTIHNFQPSDEARARFGGDDSCQIIASTLYEDSPEAVVNIRILDSSIDYVNSDEENFIPEGAYRQNDIYTLQGVCLKRNASQSDIDALAPGLYIIGGKKVIMK